MATEGDRSHLLPVEAGSPDGEGGESRLLSAEAVGNLQRFQEPPSVPVSFPDTPPKEPLYNRCWFRDLRPWQVLLLVAMQMFLLLMNLGLAGVFLIGWRRSHGQCVLGFEYLPSGGMGDTSSPYWCDQVIYVSFAAISVLFSCIMVNWTAQLAASHRWLVIQLTATCLSLVAIVGYFCLFIYKFLSWCHSMKSSVACQLEPDCDAKRRAIHTCYDAARFFDVDLMKDENMVDAYWLTLYELALVGSSLLPWIGLVVICAERLKTSCMKRESKSISSCSSSEDGDSEEENVEIDDMLDEN